LLNLQSKTLNGLIRYIIRCCGNMSCVLCESDTFQLTLAVDVLVVAYSVRLD